ncbi:transportin-3 [Trichonephila clavipes]|nr:transportin-3 [Trichonephila clavipes]
MDSQPTLQIVCQAIYSLYHNPDPAEKEKASNYLGELQRSVYAWKIADELLQHRGDLESCYFAAQTMRTKIQFSFHELPAESHSSLRDSLLNHISHVTNDTSSVILTQLCLALSDLALQMATWKSPVNDLIARFGSSTQHISTLLEILTVLPEEINSRHLRLGANRRNQVNENFCQVAPQVLLLMVNPDSQSTVHNASSDALCSALVVVEGFGNLQTLDLLLICVGHHDFEVAEITFNVWYRLSEMLYKRNEDVLNSIFEPYIQRLIVALCRHCQLDSDHEGVPEEGDDFSEFRRRVSDLIKDVVFIIGSSKCFQQMFENLCNQGNYATWDASEASLFIMGAVAKNIVPEENRIVPRVVEAILNLPEASHIAVRYTSTYLLGELCDWIEKHPQYLDPTLNFLLSCLQKKPLSTVAATALQNICATCKKQMASHFNGLLQIIQAIDTFSLSNDATVGLLRGTALILGQMSHEKITDGLMELCKTQTTPLSLLLKEDKSSLKEGTKSDPAVWLDRLAAIFRYTTPSITNGQMHPCLPVVEKIWPLLSETCGKYQSDVRIIERCCRCVRFAVRCVGKQSVSLLQPLVTQVSV